ncbi:MAG: TolC family protein [Sphingobacteriales bacterium]|nr:MAG: TolC family protein [Sphingobacteriales bacterium]
MKFRLTWMLLLSAFITTQVSSQEKKPLSLDEAINLGITNSKQLKNSQAKIEEATAALKEAVEKKLPNAGISGSYLRINNPNIDLKTKSSNTGGNTSGSPKVNQVLYGMMNVSLPIYAGGRISYGIESAKYLEQATKLDAEDDKDEVIQNTIEAFANLFKANTAVILVKENLLQSQQRVKDFENLVTNGLMARNDLLKAELQESNTELSLVDAENNLQLANVNMNLLLGLPVNTQLSLDTNGIAKKDDVRGLPDFLQQALSGRKDAEALDLRKKAAQSGVKSVKAEMYPSLQLTGGYIAADIPNFLTVTNAVNLGVGVSYNIGSLWKTKSKVQQAEAKVKQLAITEEMMGDNITLQVNKGYFNLISSRKKIEVNAKALELATENYRVIKNKFDNSLATATDLLEADAALLQAKLAYTLSRADAFVAYHKLLQTAGILASDLKK